MIDWREHTAPDEDHSSEIAGTRLFLRRYGDWWHGECPELALYPSFELCTLEEAKSQFYDAVIRNLEHRLKFIKRLRDASSAKTESSP